jgi:hypothetical protein
MIKIFILVAIVSFIYFAFELWRAPVYDENLKLIRPPKKLKDLFKR